MISGDCGAYATASFDARNLVSQYNGVFSDAISNDAKIILVLITAHKNYKLNTLWLPLFLTGIMKSVWWMPRL